MRTRLCASLRRESARTRTPLAHSSAELFLDFPTGVLAPARALSHFARACRALLALMPITRCRSPPPSNNPRARASVYINALLIYARCERTRALALARLLPRPFPSVLCLAGCLSNSLFGLTRGTNLMDDDDNERARTRGLTLPCWQAAAPIRVCVRVHARAYDLYYVFNIMRARVHSMFVGGDVVGVSVCKCV